MLTERQAYRAMYFFLDRYYELTQADDVGALLGSMSLLPDGQPADPALWRDWQEAVEKALSTEGGIDLKLGPR